MSDEYSSRFKAEIAIEAISGTKTLQELSIHFKVPVDKIESWKNMVIQNAQSIFQSPLDNFIENRYVLTKKEKIDFEFFILNETYILYSFLDHIRNNIRCAVVDSFMQVALECADMNEYEDDQGNTDPYASYPDEIYGLINNIGDKEALKNTLMDALCDGLAGKDYIPGTGWI